MGSRSDDDYWNNKYAEESEVSEDVFIEDDDDDVEYDPNDCDCCCCTGECWDRDAVDEDGEESDE